jgi:hypothetical protein
MASLPFRQANPLRSGAEGADEDHLLGILADVDEAAGAGKLRSELADIEIAGAIDLGEAQKRRIETSAVIEVKLIGLIDHRLGIDGGAEIDAAGGDPADHPGLRRQGNEVDDPLFVGHCRDALGHADAEIDDAVGFELECRAPCDDLAFAHRHRR